MVSRPLLERFGEFVATHLGLDFPESRHRDLERGLLAAVHDFGCDDVHTCIRWLISTTPTLQQIEVLARHLTVGETYFFRETRLFDALEQRILPELIDVRRAGDRRLRIWSAGCATGEEPYSIAIVLSRLLPDLQQWNVTLLGTDINAKWLHTAQQGVYGEWSFRNAPGWLKEEYFRQRNDARYELLPSIRGAVTFAFVNLAQDSYPSVTNDTHAMDVIFCCNVLMYLTPETRAQVVERFYRALVDGGWLIVTSAEAMPALFPQFESVTCGDALMFRRPQTRDAVTERIAWTPPVPLPCLPTEPPPQPSPGASPTTAGEPEPQPEPYDEAFVLCERGRYQEAAQLLQPLREARAYALLARVHANQGELEQALEWCEKAIAAESVNAAYHHLHAAILLELNRHGEAADALKRALYLEPDLVLAHVALASLFKRLGRNEDAGRHFRNALSLLKPYARDALVPHAEGLTAGRLRETIQTLWPEAKP